MSSKAAQILNAYGSQMAESAGARKRFEGRSNSNDVFHIELSKIVRDEKQPRQEFDEDELSRLADSLKEKGQLQPIRVYWDPAQERYVLLAGERRWRAAQRAGLTTLQAVVAEGAPSEIERLEIALVENCLRENLKPMEQAQAYRRLMDHNGWTGKQVADALRLHPSTVTTAMQLLKLPEELKEQIDSGELSARTARDMLRSHKRTKKSPKASRKPVPATVKTTAGVVVVTPKKGSTYEAVLQQALQQLSQSRAA